MLVLFITIVTLKMLTIALGFIELSDNTELNMN